MGVSTAPGRMALTRMLSGANSIAMARVRASNPPFEAAYAAILAEVWIAWTDETLTIAPPPAAFKSGWASLTNRKTERRLDAMTASHSSTVVSTKGFATWTAALLTKASSVG